MSALDFFYAIFSIYEWVLPLVFGLLIAFSIIDYFRRLR